MTSDSTPGRVAVATELPNHITHADTRRRLAINEILLRPAGQQ